MNILIIGASGFIGSNLIAKLEEIDNFRIFKIVRQKATSIKSDLVFTLEECIGNFVPTEMNGVHFDVICNFAGKKAPIAISQNTYDNLFQLNCQYPFKLIQRYSTSTTRVVSLSTYVQCHPEVSKFPINSYPAAKGKLSRLLSSFCASESLKLLDIRLFTLFGQLDNSNNLIPSLLRAASRGEDIYMTQGNQLISLTPVEDLLNLLVNHISNSSSTYSETINFWKPEYLQLKELIPYILDVWKLKAEIHWGKREYSGYEMFNEWSFDGKFIKSFLWSDVEEELKRLLLSTQG